MLKKLGIEKSALRHLIESMDWMMLASVLFLLTVGLVSVYSATLHFGGAGKFFTTQLAAIAIGGASMIFFQSVNYQLYRRWFYFFYALTIIMLLSVLIFGQTIRGTKGWFNFGYFSFQPVEITKIIYIIVLASYLDQYWRYIKRWQTLLVPVLMLVGNLVLILLQPDFGSTLVYFPVTVILLYVAGAEPLYLLALVMLCGIAAGIPLLEIFLRIQPALLKAHPALNYIVVAANGGWPAFMFLGSIVIGLLLIWWFLFKLKIEIPFLSVLILCGIIIGGSLASVGVQHSLKEYQKKRLIVFLNPNIDPLGSGYNIIQSKIAIGSGRVFGKGIFQGTQSQLGFLPEQHTDFIFSVLGEETGFSLSMLTIFFYSMLVWRAMVIAREARDRYGSLIATGIATMFAFYVVINIGMVMGLMPSTGLPLPLLSYGGSDIVSALTAVGLLLSIHIRRFTNY
jgi:rod shape determining protein RodA